MTDGTTSAASERAVSQQCRDALSKGDTIAAIKLVRQELGLDLARAKQWVDNYRAQLAGGGTRSGMAAALPSESVAALNDGDVIAAIRHLRAVSGLGLKESKDCVDAYLRDHPLIAAQFEERSAPRRQRARLWSVIVTMGAVGALYFWLR